MLNKVIEYFYMICLDENKNEIRTLCLAEGNESDVCISVEKLVAMALSYNAKYIIVAHNHPSGKAFASKDDLILTNKIIAMLKMTNIKLIDHIIVTEDKYYSISYKGIFDFGYNF